MALLPPSFEPRQERGREGKYGERWNLKGGVGALINS